MLKPGTGLGKRNPKAQGENAGGKCRFHLLKLKKSASTSEWRSYRRLQERHRRERTFCRLLHENIYYRFIPDRIPGKIQGKIDYSCPQAD